MAVYREDIVDIELETGTVFRSFLNKAIGEGDKNANRFGFRCLRNGVPITLSQCTIIGNFIKADGTTVTINGGSVNGEVAYITLPQSCYAVEGQFQLSIKLSAVGGAETTIRIVDGTVVNTTLGTVIDPGQAVPDLASLLAVIEDAETAAERIYTLSVTAELISGDDYMIVVEEGT